MTHRFCDKSCLAEATSRNCNCGGVVDGWRQLPLIMKDGATVTNDAAQMLDAMKERARDAEMLRDYRYENAWRNDPNPLSDADAIALMKRRQALSDASFAHLPKREIPIVTDAQLDALKARSDAAREARDERYRNAWKTGRDL